MGPRVYPTKCNISKLIQHHKYAKYRTYTLLSISMNNVQFQNSKDRKSCQVVEPLMEPKLNLLAQQNVAPNPMVMSKCDSQFYIYAET